MKKTKLPTSYKGGAKCKSCGAMVIHSYNWDNELYQWKCQGCNAVRYEPRVRFEVRFQEASEIGK